MYDIEALPDVFAFVRGFQFLFGSRLTGYLLCQSHEPLFGAILEGWNFMMIDSVG